LDDDVAAHLSFLTNARFTRKLAGMSSAALALALPEHEWPDVSKIVTKDDASRINFS
jgi:hypothetical protein